MQASPSTSTATDTAFRVQVEGGDLVGRVRGPVAGRRLLLVHGGPGMSERFFDEVIEELSGRYRVASFQQRGLLPSTAGAPYDVATQVQDVLAVLDALGWDTAVVLGHSWGAHLLLHVMAMHPERLDGAIVVEPLGAVGDGGMSEFGENLLSRIPAANRARIDELDARSDAGGGTVDDFEEGYRLLWPGYFTDPGAVSPYLGLALSQEANERTLESAMAEFASLAPRLVGCTVPTVFIHGSGSPMPVTASTDTAAVIGDAASVVVLDGVGHMIWLEDLDQFCHAVDDVMTADIAGLDHAERRSLMGRALGPLGGTVNETRPGWWAVITGGPGADANMVLVDVDDEERLEHVTVLVARENVPALLMLAGEGVALGARMPEQWEHVGSMPVMSLDLADAVDSVDVRVRRATAADAETVIRLIVDAYELEYDVASVFVRPVLGIANPVLGYWILEEDGVGVSTVMSGRVDDTVSLWCMSTPPAHQRHGYGRALLATVLNWARNDGATLGLLGATPAGYPLYEATGWSTFENWEMYVNAPSAQFSH